MYAVLNRDELVTPLADRLIVKHLRHVDIQWNKTTEYIEKCNDNYIKTNLLNIDFGTVNSALTQDLRAWKDEVMIAYKGNYRKLIQWLVDNLDRHALDRQYLIDLCVNDTRPSFVKTIARQLSDNPTWVLQNEEFDLTQPTLIRNILGNEELIKAKLEGDYPFWFIDSGYTNFLTSKKKWHRLVKNHLHHDSGDRVFPADRLTMFEKMPRPWHKQGTKILVVESSDSYYKMKGTTLDDWRGQIKSELRKLTDREIEFKSKTGTRKDRTSVYDLISQNPKDYYCVISDSSAAAIEAVWLGVPIITLGQHISTPVARTSCSDINNLYYGPIGNWLCALSYSQFTVDEMMSGRAYKFMRKLHGV